MDILHQKHLLEINNTKQMKKVLLCLFLFFYCCIIHAQKLISTTGNSETNNNVNISWTIGEPITYTVNNSTNTITQGFLQSKLIVTSIKETFTLENEIKAYPNPVKDFIILKISNKEISQKKYRYQLTDINGKIIKSCFISDNEINIYMSAYSPGKYILNIFDDNANVKQFKIIKL